MQSPKDLMQDIAANHFAQARAAAIIPDSVFLLYRISTPNYSGGDKIEGLYSKGVIGSYIHKSTAEYEMHICIQGDEDAVARGTWMNVHEYEIAEVPLTRHKEF